MFRWLATPGSMRECAERFGIGISTLHYVIRDVCCAIIDRFQVEVIKFPESDVEWQCVRKDFSALFGMPNVAGAVDGSHIRIHVPPRKKQRAYYNRKGFHSIILQGTVKANGSFMDVYCGWPGSVSDARVWENSSLSQQLQETIPRGSFLLGDKAYTLTHSMMTPYRRNDETLKRNRAAKLYNKVHSQTRVVVEGAFGALRMRWRRLTVPSTVKLEFVPDVVMSACILHNLCKLHHDPLPKDKLKAYVERERLFAERLSRENRRDVAEGTQRVLQFQQDGSVPTTVPGTSPSGLLVDFQANTPKDLRLLVGDWLLSNKRN